MSEDQIIRITDDDVFAWIFGRNEQKMALVSLINAVLTDSGFPPVKNVSIANPFTLKSYKNDKKSILDIKAEDENDNKYDIEMQSCKDDYHVNRLLYYCARLYGNQLQKTELYHSLRPVIGMSFLRPVLFPENKNIHNCFLLQEIRTQETLTDHLQLHFIELVKRSGVNPLEDLHRWIEFFISEEDENKMKTLAKQSEALDMAYEAYTEFKSNSELTEMHWARVESKRTVEDMIEDASHAAEQRGMAEGREEGRKEGREEGAYGKALQTARNFLKMGLSVEQVIEGTGLSSEEVEQIKKKQTR